MFWEAASHGIFRVQGDSVRGEYVPTSCTLGFNANLPKIALSYISQCTFAEDQLCAAHFSKCRTGRAIARNPAQIDLRRKVLAHITGVRVVSLQARLDPGVQYL